MANRTSRATLSAADTSLVPSYRYHNKQCKSRSSNDNHIARVMGANC